MRKTCLKTLLSLIGIWCCPYALPQTPPLYAYYTVLPCNYTKVTNTIS